MIAAHKKTIGGAQISFLGSSEASALLVVVGRNNHKKPSAALDALVKDLHALGLSVCWFETRATQTFKRLDEQFEKLVGPRVSVFCGKHIQGKVFRKMLKAALLLMQPARWDGFLRFWRNPNRHLAQDLRRFLRQLPAQKIHLLAHSAGGIVSSLVESEACVGKLVCWGYPFKHPEKPEEAIRTAHLAHMQKPFLILQGQADEYGTAEDAKRYPLSPCIRVLPIQAGHDYDKLSEHEYAKCLALLQDFFQLDRP